MKIMNINQRKMEKFESTEFIELVPCELQRTLTKKQTLLLGYFIMLNGLEESKTNGTFYRSNDDILEDLAGEITKPTLISAIRTLETKNLIERTSGYRNKDGKQASIYKLNENNIFKNQSNMNSEITLELVKVIKAMQEQINFQNKIIGKILLNQDLTLNLTHQNPLNKEVSSDMGKVQLNENLTLNLTSDTESDIDKDINNNINKIINNIKETSNNINNKLNIIKERENIINNIQEKEDDNELDSTEFENEVEDNEEIINEYQVEEEIDDTNTLTDEQLEARLINYFNEEKDTITNEHQLNEFETVFNMVLQNFKDNEQITNEQLNHARLFIVQPKLSELRYKLVQLNKLNKDTVEPSNEETLTTIQPSEENASEPKEMPLNQKNTNRVAKEEGGEAITLDFEEALKEDTETANSVHVTPTDKTDKLISYDDALKTFIPRMHELYSQCNTKEDIQETYTTIIKGIEDFNSKGKFNNNTYNKLKSVAWESRAKYEIPIYRKAYEEKKAKEAAESVSSVAA